MRYSEGMAWHCPACQTLLELNKSIAHPRDGVGYRCHVCRATMKYSAISRTLVITSTDADGARPVDPHAPRVRPVSPKKLHRKTS